MNEILKIRLKITFLLSDETGIYVGANSFALSDFSYPHKCCSSQSREVISRPILIGLIAASLAVSPHAQAGQVTTDLQTAIKATADHADVPVIIGFSDQLDIPALRAMMIEKMQQKSKKTIQQLQDFLKSHGTHRKLKPLWAVNSIAAELPADLIGKLAALQDVNQVTLDAKIQGTVTDTVPASPNFWNLDATHAPNLWELGIPAKASSWPAWIPALTTRIPIWARNGGAARMTGSTLTARRPHRLTGMAMAPRSWD